MQPKPLKQDQDQLFTSRLSQQLNPAHELLKLVKVIPWEQLETDSKLLFSEGRSRLPLPVGLPQDWRRTAKRPSCLDLIQVLRKELGEREATGLPFGFK